MAQAVSQRFKFFEGITFLKIFDILKTVAIAIIIWLIVTRVVPWFMQLFAKKQDPGHVKGVNDLVSKGIPKEKAEIIQGTLESELTRAAFWQALPFGTGTGIAANIIASAYDEYNKKTSYVWTDSKTGMSGAGGSW